MRKVVSYIFAVYKEGSFSKAAEKLFVSQPALSLIIKKEEQRIGMPIFERKTNPLKLTAVGKQYLEIEKKIALLEEEFENHIKQYNNTQQETLNIGSSAFFCANYLPSLIGGFTTKYSSYSVNTVEGSGRELIQQLRTGNLNFIIEVENHDANIYNSIKIDKEFIILAVPSFYYVNEQLEKYALRRNDIVTGKFLNTEIKGISFKYFNDVPFILLKKGNDLFHRAQNMFKRSGINPKIVMYLDQVQTAYFAAKDGNGATFIRANLLNYTEPTDKLIFYKINSNLAERNVYLVYKKASKLKESENNFINYCKEKFNVTS